MNVKRWTVVVFQDSGQPYWRPPLQVSNHR